MKETKYFLELTDAELKEVYESCKADGDKFVTPLNLGMIDQDIPAYSQFKYVFIDGKFKGALLIDNSTRYNDYVVITHNINYDDDIKRYLDAVNNGIIPKLENCII